MKYLSVMLLIIILIQVKQSSSQKLDGEWDDILYVSNRFGFGKSDNWRHSFAYQSRMKEEFTALQQWNLRYKAKYLVNDEWNLEGNFRFIRKPENTEYSAGLGIVHQNLFERASFVQRISYGAKLNNEKKLIHGVGVVVAYPYSFSNHILGVPLVATGFQHTDSFTGLSGLRAGASIAYIFNQSHALSIGCFYGAVNKKDDTNQFTSIRIYSIQLVINTYKIYRYAPLNVLEF